MRRTSLLIVIALTAVVACNSEPRKPTQPSSGSAVGSPPDARATSPIGPPAVLTVQVNKFDEEGDETTEFHQTFDDPDATLIAEKVKSLDWQNRKLRCDVRVAFKITQPDQRDAIQQKGVLSVSGGLKTQNVDGLLKATWQGNGALRSPPLDSLDQAIGLLVAFRNDDEKWRTLVQWTKLE